LWTPASAGFRFAGEQKELLPHRAEAVDRPHALAARYRREGVVYGIEVILPDDGDALTGWLQRRLGWFSVRACSRRYSTLCSISRHASGVRVEAISLPDLLMHFTIYEAAESEDAAKQRIDQEISKLREVRG
jgi:hypothetical protein